MAISSFTYDGISLKTFNGGKYILGYFSADENPKEGDRNYNKVSLYMGLEQPFVYSNYEDTITFTLGIIKNPCATDEAEITIEEMEELKRWLCRPAPHIFQLDEPEYEDIYWEGTFHLEEQLTGSKRAGIIITFESTRPYALQNEVIFEGSVEAGESIIIEDSSVEIGYIYPTINITCKEDGKLTIVNSYDNRQTIVDNCTNEEIIYFSKYLQIASSDTSHILADDFNFKFLRIGNNMETRTNEISFSLACDYSIAYNPIRKVIPV